MSRFWMFMLIGFVCFVLAMVYARLNVVYVRGYPSTAAPVRTVDEVRGWAPDVTNAGASAGFAIAGGLCMIAAAMTDRRSATVPPLEAIPIEA